MSITVRWLREDEAFTFRCDPCQITRRLGRTELLALLGDVALETIALQDELRCTQCRQHPTLRLADLAEGMNASARARPSLWQGRRSP